MRLRKNQLCKKIFSDDKKESHILVIRIYGQEKELKEIQTMMTEVVNDSGGVCDIY